MNLSDSGRYDVMARHGRQLNTHKNNFNPNYLGCLWIDLKKLNGIESDFFLDFGLVWFGYKIKVLSLF